MKHRCQSSLVRCALRGQHPKPVVYPFMSAWVVVDRLRTNGPHWIGSRGHHRLAAVLDEVRSGYTGQHAVLLPMDPTQPVYLRPAHPQPGREVPC